MGLRGDPQLWAAMAEQFVQTAIPSSEEYLLHMLHDAFAAQTGVAVDHPKNVYTERFERGGMSRGMVSPRFWREVAFPLLMGRFRGSATADHRNESGGAQSLTGN